VRSTGAKAAKRGVRVFAAFFFSIHHPFSPSQKERQSNTKTIQGAQMTANNHINNTTTKRQIELCNSKNKMEQCARYLLPDTERT